MIKGKKGNSRFVSFVAGNTSSLRLFLLVIFAGLNVNPLSPVYSATKAGIIALTRSLSVGKQIMMDTCLLKIYLCMNLHVFNFSTDAFSVCETSSSSVHAC